MDRKELKMKKIAVLYIPSDEDIRLMEIYNDIDTLIKIVGKNIEYHDISESSNVQMVANKTEKDKKSNLNVRACYILNMFTTNSCNFLSESAIFGDVIIEGYEANEENTGLSLPPKELENIIEACINVDFWWNSTSKKVNNSNYIKWYLNHVDVENKF